MQKSRLHPSFCGSKAHFPMNKFFILIAVVMSLAVCAGAQSISVSGSPDREFGRRGYISEVVSDQSRIVVPIDAVASADGSLIVISSAVAVFPGSAMPIRFHLTKYTSEGSRDYSFGIFGEVDDAFPGTASPISAAFQPDGKIVVAGNIRDAGAPTDFLIARYHADGRRDLEFGDGGFFRADFAGFGTSSADVVKRIFIQNDGKIAVIGHRTVSDGFDPANDFIAVAALRLHANGTPDDSFGPGGKSSTVELALGGQFVMSEIKRLSNGGFLLGFAGREKAGSGIVAKLLKLGADALPDANFGERGFLNIAAGGIMTPVGETPNGDFLIASPSGLLALKSDGAMRGWMISGTATVNGAMFQATAFAASENGSVICFGIANRAGRQRQAMIRLLADGERDLQFGANGLREESFDLSSQRNARNIISPNGQILAIHQTTDFSRVLIQRWHGPGAPPTSKYKQKSFLK